MKKLICIAFSLFIISTLAFSQAYFPNSITFSSQKEIDAFQSNYPRFIEIEGDIIIEESKNGDITNLDSLKQIKSIGGHLLIWNNDALTSLTGLDSLISIGKSLSIDKNSSLTSLTGLDNLSSISGFLCIGHNASLISLTGLDNLSSIGGHLLVENNDVLTSLTGLDSLISIGKNLEIGHNKDLVSLSGLDNLSSIGGYLKIYNNAVLTSLSGIQNIDPNTIETIISWNEDLEIYNNPSLSECEVQSICDFLDLLDKTKEIHDNMSGCNSEEEVQNVCDKTATHNLELNEINIYPNPAKDDFTIDFSNTKLSNAEISIFDVSGKQQLNLEKKTSDKVLNVESEVLNAGLYIIRIKSAKFGTSFRKVILSK